MSSIKFFDKDSKLIAPSLIEGSDYVESQVIGAVLWLWTHSKIHSEIPIGFLPNLLFPAIVNQQFVLVLEQDQPVFYLSWAYLSEESEYSYIHEPKKLMKFEDWVGGERMWILDWVAPFGHTVAAKKLVYRHLLANQCFRHLHHRGAERGMRVIANRGNNVSREEFCDWNRRFPVKRKTATKNYN
jgi:cytolysin-activating lysine-acyltransferase